MLKEKALNFIHKEEDLLREKLEKLEENEIIKEEIQFGIGPEEREALAKQRAEERAKHHKEIEEKRLEKKEHHKVEAINEDILEKFLAGNKL